MSQKNSWVRTVYLYLFALVGLTLVIIGGVRLLNMGLKVFIFTEADKLDDYRAYPPFPPYGVLEPRSITKETPPEDIKVNAQTQELTSEEKTALNNWEIDYKNWQAQNGKVDYLKARRQQEASISLALIIVGLPLYLYHWAVIKRDKKKEEI